jgi:DNA-binding beta-propeller fold protein YncE
MLRRTIAGLALGALLAAGCSDTDPAAAEPQSPGTVPETTISEAAAGAVSSTSASTIATAASTTTTVPPPRPLSVTAGPDEATLTITDASGVVYGGPPPFSGEVVGTVELVARADGYATESATLGVDATSHALWLDDPGQILDKIAEFGTGPAPKQVAFRPGHDEVWVTLLAGAGFEVYDARSGEQLAAVDLPDAGSVEVIFNRAGTLAYISQMETASVYEVDAETKSVLRRLPTRGTWTKVMALSPDERTLWASNWVSNDVSEIDLGSGEVRRKLKTVATPRGLYVTPDARKLYVAGFDQGEIQVFDLETGEGEVIHRSGGAMRHLVGSPDGSQVYASDMARATTLVVDVATNEVRELAPVDRVPNTIDLSPDGKVLYVSNRGRNNPETYYKPGPEWGTVVVVDVATGAYLDAIVGGNQTTGLDVSPDGTLLAYSDFLDDRVAVYAIPRYEVLAAGGGGRWEQHLVDLEK